MLERPEATVRGWIRRARGLAEQIRVAFTLVRADLLAESPALAPTASPMADAVNAVLALAAAAAARFGELAGVAGRAPWEVACAVTGGMLLAPPIIGFRINMNCTLVVFGH